jgi:hypothetical protein
MFSVDWPFISNKMATDWLNASALSAADKSKVFSGNAKSLLKLWGVIPKSCSCKHERHAARRSHSRSGAAGFASRSR